MRLARAAEAVRLSNRCPAPREREVGVWNFMWNRCSSSAHNPAVISSVHRSQQQCSYGMSCSNPPSAKIIPCVLIADADYFL